eukprot:CAMPEP_0185270760 /NCGR_PEP_ID=MMETSP1359-20130426/43099_1 /TAXON_ID=552665 /ORGANISM="Bigelowiella longifila, Strain CCMP242" /LENGTH=334 /DNA_ID=CAMNT_0027862463 /DNA_START=87 /DNA_END=1089 /DNA_ORIENTATION=+
MTAALLANLPEGECPSVRAVQGELAVHPLGMHACPDRSPSDFAAGERIDGKADLPHVEPGLGGIVPPRFAVSIPARLRPRVPPIGVWRVQPRVGWAHWVQHDDVVASRPNMVVARQEPRVLPRVPHLVEGVVGGVVAPVEVDVQPTARAFPARPRYEGVEDVVLPRVAVAGRHLDSRVEMILREPIRRELGLIPCIPHERAIELTTAIAFGAAAVNPAHTLTRPIHRGALARTALVPQHRVEGLAIQRVAAAHPRHRGRVADPGVAVELELFIGLAGPAPEQLQGVVADALAMRAVVAPPEGVGARSRQVLLRIVNASRNLAVPRTVSCAGRRG